MPGMDSSMPYAEDVVPSLMMPSFLKMSSLTTDLFTLTDKLENVTQGLRKDLGLLLSPDERRAAGMPAVIGYVPTPLLSLVLMKRLQRALPRRR